MAPPAVWSEFEGLDGPEPLWRVPAERMMMRRDHLVPLGRQAAEAVEAAQAGVPERQGAFCAVCDIAVAAALDAAHVIPKGSDGSDDARNGLALCVLHHRLFDAGLFAIDPGTLMLRAHPDHTLDDMRITRTGIGHLEKRPHADALAWRWEHLPLP